MRTGILGFFRYIAVIAAFAVFMEAWTFPVYANEATVLRSMDDTEKVVYLTFDDGPDTVNTISVMNTLLKYDVQGTFFFTGVFMANCPSAVKEVYDNGFNIGLHGYGHASFAKMSADGLRKDINSTNDVLEKITGERSRIVRPPYGATNDTVVKTLGEMGFKAYMWNIDPKDWAKTSTDASVLQNIKQNLKPGAIILLHSSPAHDRAARVLPKIIEYISSQGYQMKALPDTGYKSVLAERSSTKIEINGNSSGLPAYLINGSSYVKIRALAEALNGTEKQFHVSWDESQKAVNIITGAPYQDYLANEGLEGSAGNSERVKRAAPSSAAILLDGTPAPVTSYTVNGETCFNLRELAKALDIELTFDAASGTIGITTPALPDYFFSRFRFRVFAFMSRLLSVSSI